METAPPLVRPPSSAIRIASYVLAGAALVLVLGLRLLPALFAGLLVYEIVQSTAPLLGKRVPGDRARMLVVALLGTIVVGLLVLLILSAVSFLRNEIGNPEVLWQQQLMPLVEKAREQLPATVVGWLPDSVDDLRVMAGQGTTALELLQDVPDLDSLIVCAGGGGLLSGCTVAARHLRPAIEVFGAEPERGNDMQRSLREGRIVSIDVPRTICDGQQTQAVGKHPFEVIQAMVKDVLTVPDPVIRPA